MTHMVENGSGRHPRRCGLIRCFFALAAIPMLAMGCSSDDDSETGAAENQSSQSSLELPDRPSERYAGSAACQKCHSDISDEYATHPMSQSVALAHKTTADDGVNEFSPTDGLTYYVSKDADEVLHHEKRFDASGETIYDDARRIDIAVGSGQRGRTYLLNRDGRLFASPITWYSEAGEWGLSPGYAANGHFRFDRRISHGCLSCHAGRVEPHPDDLNRFAKQPLIEPGIGCERCHGPGLDHIAFHESGDSESGEDPIVNPHHFSDSRRDAVCSQCHLPGERRVVRYGRSEFDFRPGMYLSDNWIIFLRDSGSDAELAVSQVEQLHNSTCFTSSEGKMSCTSCHDPHRTPEPGTELSFYRSKCVNCHSNGQTECSEPPARRLAVSSEDACTTCHMPSYPAQDVHAAQTDHRILRIPDRSEADAETEESNSKPTLATVLDEPGADVPRVELERANGIYFSEQARARQDKQLATRAINLLLGTLKKTEQDVEGRLALGEAFIVVDQPDLAVQAWEQVLQLQPTHEDALEALAVYYQQQKDWANARKYLQALVNVNPDRARYFGRLAYVLGEMGDVRNAIAAANHAIELDPSLVQTHMWLTQIHTRMGNPTQAEFHQKMVERFQSFSKSDQSPQGGD